MTASYRASGNVVRSTGANVVDVSFADGEDGLAAGGAGAVVAAPEFADIGTGTAGACRARVTAALGRATVEPAATSTTTSATREIPTAQPLTIGRRCTAAGGGEVGGGAGGAGGGGTRRSRTSVAVAENTSGRWAPEAVSVCAPGVE